MKFTLSDFIKLSVVGFEYSQEKMLLK